MKFDDIDTKMMGQAVKDKRTEMSLSQKALAGQFNLSDAYVYYLEKGQAEKLNASKVEKILAVLGLSYSMFRKDGRRKRGVAPAVATPQEKIVGKPGKASAKKKAKAEKPAAPPAKKPSRAVEKKAELEPREESVPAGEMKEGGTLFTETDKEMKEYGEWIREQTPLEVKLKNGEVFAGRMKWYDRDALKLETAEGRGVVMKTQGILYIIEAEGAGW